MQIKLVVLGKTDHKAIQELIADYSTRLGHYIRFELEVIPDLKQSKSLSETLQNGRNRTGTKQYLAQRVAAVRERCDSRQFSRLFQHKNSYQESWSVTNTFSYSHL